MVSELSAGMASLRLNSLFLTTKVEYSSRLQNFDGFDCLVIVADKTVKDTRVLKEFGHINEALEITRKLDANAEKTATVTHTETFKRVVFAPTGPINRDTDDVRRYEEAAFEGVKRAMCAGAKTPFVYIDVPEELRANPLYINADLVATLGALRAVYVPLEVREADSKRASKVDRLGFFYPNEMRSAEAGNLATILEAGRIVARDIGGSDPERMAAPRVVEYVKETFAGADNIKIDVVDDQQQLERDFPLLGAVNRAASVIPRHQGRLIFMEYTGEGPIQETVLLVGKGITYDTGGADVKAGGVMAGMHRDKCGAAAVAGFFKILSILKPKGIKVIGGLSMIRNSIGENCYVADEIITSRAGVRVRVGNTDAEGRMVMTDVLCYLKERIIKEQLPNPQMYTLATLTGHAVMTAGPAYSLVLDNGPAKKQRNSLRLYGDSEAIGEPVELSSIRREDYEFNAGKSEYEDILQCNNLPSSRTARGHQSPAAFMIVSSGLDKHGIDSQLPIPYTHIDIAGSSGPYPGIPTGTPILGLCARHILHRLGN